MKEFDKIYLAKYNEILTPRQLAEDLFTTITETESIIRELKATGLYEIYKNIPDEEWEKLEKKTDKYVLNKYMCKSETQNKKAWKELIEAFTPEKHNFIEYDPIKDEIKHRMNMVILNEEWKQIVGCQYSVSNYGRIRNDTTKKIKSLRCGRYGYQVNLWKNGQAKMFTISRLVAHYFIREVNSNERVKHIDGDIRNNYYKNLEIVSM